MLDGMWEDRRHRFIRTVTLPTAPSSRPRPGPERRDLRAGLADALLYRGHDLDSGGPGADSAAPAGDGYIPYNGEMGLGVYSAEGVPKTSGVIGGLPGNAGQTLLLPARTPRRRSPPGNCRPPAAELGGESVPLFGKGDAVVVAADDVFEWNWTGSGGYGDPSYA